MDQLPVEIKIDDCWIHSYTHIIDFLNYTSPILFFTIWAAIRQNQQSECAPSEDLDQPGHPRSESSLSAWRNIGSLATHWAHSEDSDQTGWMPRLIWVFTVHTATLLVLSCRGSYNCRIGEVIFTQRCFRDEEGCTIVVEPLWCSSDWREYYQIGWTTKCQIRG